jgi:hypothetical protein
VLVARKIVQAVKMAALAEGLVALEEVLLLAMAF